MTRPIMPSPLSSSAAPLSPGVGRAPVRPTPGQRSVPVEQGEGSAGTGQPFPHGTYAGYKRHRRRLEKPCPACKVPFNERRQARYAARYLTVDEVAVERRLSGDRTVRLNRAEVTAAWRMLEADGHTVAFIAEVLGVSERSVTRWRTGVTTPYSTLRKNVKGAVA